MQRMQSMSQHLGWQDLLKVVLMVSLAGCGGGGGGTDGDGPAIKAQPQTVTFAADPVLPLHGSAVFVATASSGLVVRYVSQTSSVCSVDSVSGQANALMPGDCIITAVQDGDATYAPVRTDKKLRVYVDPKQTVSFSAAPQNLSPGGYATVLATASSGLAVSYSSLTTSVCTVDAKTGSVLGLLEGACTIDAYQAGTTEYPVYYAKHATLTFNILPTSVPPAPAWVVAEPITATSASISFETTTPSGGFGGVTALPGGNAENLAIRQIPLRLLTAMIPSAHAADAVVTGTSYTVVSEPSGITATGTSSPIQVVCPSNCSNYKFKVFATNAQGGGQPSVPAEIVASPLPPGKPAAVYATYGAKISEVKVRVGSVDAGGAPITGYKVSVFNSTGSSMGVVQGSSLPVTVTCPVSCIGYTFAVQATNKEGSGPLSDPAGITVIGTVPGKPAGVTATLGSSAAQVIVSVGSVASGGSPITAYKVSSIPSGVTASASQFPVTVNCPGSCAGYAFSVQASNPKGDGAESDAANVVTSYYVLETLHEPATQPNDSIFIGAYDFDSTNRTVSNLRGFLTESMSGGCATIAGCPGSYGNVPMTMILTSYQLDSEAVTLGGVSGRLVTTFALNTTNTFFNASGGDGWSPQHGVDVGGVYYGWPKAKNPYNGGVGNSSATIFVNTADPTIALQQAQIDKLAYADCAYGGMMGAVCMTGTSIAGYGAVGTMGGYPVSQVTVRQCSDLNALDTLHAQGRLSVGKTSFCQSLDASHP